MCKIHGQSYRVFWQQFFVLTKIGDKGGGGEVGDNLGDFGHVPELGHIINDNVDILDDIKHEHMHAAVF